MRAKSVHTPTQTQFLMEAVIRSIFTSESNPGLRALMLVILSIVLMVLDRRVPAFTSVRAAMTIPAAPFEYAVGIPTRVIDFAHERFRSHQSLADENARLKSEQLLLQSRLQRLTAIESENNYLKSLLQSAQKINGKTLIAELMAVSTEPFMHQVTLNKGRKDGVYEGQPVFDAGGVMGQVISAARLPAAYY